MKKPSPDRARGRQNREDSSTFLSDFSAVLTRQAEERRVREDEELAALTRAVADLNPNEYGNAALLRLYDRNVTRSCADSRQTKQYRIAAAKIRAVILSRMRSGTL